MEHKYNELRKQVRDAFVDDEKSGMFPTVDWVMNYLIAQGRIVPDGCPPYAEIYVGKGKFNVTQRISN